MQLDVRARVHHTPLPRPAGTLALPMRPDYRAQSEDEVLFAGLRAAEQRGMVPAAPATVAETLAASNDPQLQQLAHHASDDVPFLVSLLTSVDAAVLEASADSLWKLAIGGQARAAIKQANGAFPLVALLGHGQPRVVRAAAGALSVLTLDAAQRTSILAAGGAGSLSGVLSNGGDREAEQAARAVANLAVEEPTRAALVDHTAPQHLASILRRRKCTPGLREASCRAVTALVTVGASTDVDGDGRGSRLASEDAAERAAAAFTAAGGSAALIDCLQPLGSNEAVPGEASGGGSGSRSVADDADESLEGHVVIVHSVAARPELNGLKGVVQSLHTSTGRFHVKLDSGETVALRPACVQKAPSAVLAASGGNDGPLAKAGARATSMLCMHKRSGDELMRLGVLPSLIRLLGSRTPEVAAAAAAALAALASVESHRNAVASSRAVAMLLRCLGEGSDRSLQEPACAALRALAMHRSVREQLGRDASALAPVVAVLSRGDAQAREASAGLLGSIALHDAGRNAVIQAGAVGPLVKLLPLRHAPTQEAATRAIANLAFAPSGAAAVAKAGGTPLLVRLLKSGSDALHSAAEGALEVLTMEEASRDQLLAALQ